MRAAVITVSSSRAAGGGERDESGPRLEAVIERLGGEVAGRETVPDDRAAIAERLRHWVDEAGCDLVLTTGGTGLAPSDVTPEGTREVIEREAPGIAEAIRADARSRTPHALLSRGVAGLRGSTLVVNLPGSPGGCRDGFEVLRPALRHGLELAAGSRDSEHRQT